MRITSIALLASTAALAMTACVGDTHTITGYAADAQFHDEIAACTDRHDCFPLCVDVLKLDVDSLDRAKVIAHNPYGARFACEIEGSTGIGVGGGVLDDGFDWDGDDSCDDGSCDDSGNDDGSMDGGGDDGSDDGSGDDGSGDDGGDGGGGSDVIVNHGHPLITSPTGATR